ncbi:MAG: zinc-dependent alcohol dehydrogenase [candidate division Zixibacteria bacterium]|nr:zinc-dependent alcohol dehydrogenase [candidate division Zixibacteria bacterium]MDH3937234.1 zinc-dependent alcohol dehydrogenase [candidate division Zixibacteria bacterium]MDH4035081.1 zinc-dependent alcohol dehydrogenase [candidate division Zixibacteria bacterium]
MAATMKAARIHAYGDELIVEDIAVPQPGAGQVLIKIIASGVCHTDLHATAGDMAGNPKLPFVPGHEIVGRVVSLGKDVSRTSEGDLVGVPSLHWACGQCEHCTGGWETLCLRQLATGYSVDGGFAEYVVAPSDFVVQIPEQADPFEMAPILCAGVTTYKGLKQTQAKHGDWVVISGVGGLGHVAVQYARVFGYRVVAVDIDDDKLALAERHGAELTVNAAKDDAVSRVHDETGGAHAVLVTAASASAFRSGVEMLRRGGVCVLNGLPPGDFPLPICNFVLAAQTVIGSIIGTRRDMDEAVKLAVEVGIRTTVEKQPLENINEIFRRLQNGQVVGRVVLDMTSN